MKKLSILIIDDEPSQIKSLEGFLKRRGYEVYTASNGSRGYETAKNNVIDLVLTDYRMPDWDGFTVLKNMKKLNPEIDVVLITAFGSIEDAVKIMKAGAYDYLTKPIDLDELENLINRIRERRLLISENKELKNQLAEKFRFETIISQSGEMEEVLNTAARVAGSRASVLIRGESGTGKELIARAIHFSSARKEKPFVVVNVAALSENLIESELFGHEKGAFTGATQQRIGRFEQADGGTLFVDEVGDIPLPVQVKLLRAIQFGEIERVGGDHPIKVDVRIIAATHRKLEEMLQSGDFRDDLYYRLNVVSIKIPTLRERKTDIPILAEHFLKKYAEENGKTLSGFSREAMDRLMKYSFPGNVRELENIVERAAVMSREEYITEQDLPGLYDLKGEKEILNPTNLKNSYEEKLRAFETEMIKNALEESGGNQSAAARILKMTERHLRSRLDILGMK